MAKLIKKHHKKAVILAIFLFVIVGYFSLKFVQAAVIDNREVRLYNSVPAATTTYDFLGDTSVANTQCIKMQFCNSANTGGICTAPTNINVSGAYVTSSAAWNVWTYASWSINTTTTNSVSIKHGSGGQNGGLLSSWVLGGIVNPDVGVFYVWINTYNNTDCASSGVDNGVVATASVAGVEVSATVLETLSFSVAALPGGTCTVSGGNNVTTTSTSVPFGTVNSDTFYNGCQSLTVGTNGSNGYDVTVGESDQLKNVGLDEIVDGVCDTSCTDVTAAGWATNGNNGFGYCMDDITGDGATTADAAWGTNSCGAGTQYFKTIANLSEVEARQKIMQSAAAVSGDVAYVGFRLTVDAAQAAGTYTNTASYVVTPKY